MNSIKEKIHSFKGNNLLWIIFLVVILYVILAQFLDVGVLLITRIIPGQSSSMKFINESYTTTIGSVILLFIVCLTVKKNHFIFRSFLPKGAERDHKIEVVEDTYEAPQENTPRNMLIGLIIGFITNGACILCAVIHGDLKFYLDFSAAMVPTLIYALLMVFIQSSSEELWCRGFLYERICIHYPLWVAVLVNGAFFGFLHIFNPGATVLAITDIIVCGLSYSLVKWYTGSIWMAMGIHTMWNFTQNFIFGLPNSGLVSETSIFHLDAMNAVSNLIYDYNFGVEGAVPAIIVDTVLGAVCLLLAKKDGRLCELTMSYEKKAELAKQAEINDAPVIPDQDDL